MQKKVGRPFFLFEILIGISLLSGLLFILFSFFTSSAKVEQKLEKASRALFERQHLIQELQNVLTSVLPVPIGKIKNSLYTQKIDGEETLSLLVYFDHGIDPDPSFSGPCLARIYLDRSQNLKLAIWPTSPENHPFVREQTLLRGVKTFTFRFLKKQKDGSFSWEKERPVEETSPISSLIYLDLWQEKTPLTLSFLLPLQEPPIIYPSHERKL